MRFLYPALNEKYIIIVKTLHMVKKCLNKIFFSGMHENKILFSIFYYCIIITVSHSPEIFTNFPGESVCLKQDVVKYMSFYRKVV